MTVQINPQIGANWTPTIATGSEGSSGQDAGGTDTASPTSLALTPHVPGLLSFEDPISSALDVGANRLPDPSALAGAMAELPEKPGVVSAIEQLMKQVQDMLAMMGITPPGSNTPADASTNSGADAGQARRDERAAGTSAAEQAGAERRAGRGGSSADATTGASGGGSGSDVSGPDSADNTTSVDGTSTPSGGPAGTINADGFGGPLTSADQTPGGKQITDGPNEGQKLHRTGLSRYENVDGVESFRAAPGGELSGSSKTSRSEAYYSGDSTEGKSFEADYKVDVDGQTTIFQMKDNKGGSPEFRVTVDDSGEVVVNTGDGSPTPLGKVQPGEEFRLSVTDNPDGTTSFGLTDSSGASLGSQSLKSSNPIDSTQFRYGNYTQGDNSTAQVLVSNVETDLA